MKKNYTPESEYDPMAIFGIFYIPIVLGGIGYIIIETIFLGIKDLFTYLLDEYHPKDKITDHDVHGWAQ